LKETKNLEESRAAQYMRYLGENRLTGGLLWNSASPRLTIRRIVNNRE
jgi:hypothetical protein